MSEPSEPNLEKVIIELLRRYKATLDNQQPRRVHSMVITEVERLVLCEVMEWADYNQLEAAKMLGIHRNTLRTKLKRYNIDIGNPRDSA